MYAIFQSSGKQYKAKEGQIVRLEKLSTKVGETVEFNEILLFIKDKNVKIGTPFINNATIKAKVLEFSRSEKLKIIKFRRRKHYRKQQGHRQWFTNVKILSINI